MTRACAMAAVADDERALEVLVSARRLSAEAGGGPGGRAPHVVHVATADLGALAPAPTLASHGVAAPLPDVDELATLQREGVASGRRLLHRIGATSAEGVVRTGDVVGTLLQELRDSGCEVLVCGTRARSPLAAGLLGSTSRALVLGSSRPTVLVPSGGPLAPGGGTVLCAIDHPEDSAATVVGAGVRLARCLRRRLALVHVAPPGPALGRGDGRRPGMETMVRDAAGRLAAYALERAGAGGSAELLLPTGSPEAELARLVDERPGDLLLVGAPDRTGVLGRASGAVWQAVSGRVRSPVAVVRTGQEAFA